MHASVYKHDKVRQMLNHNCYFSRLFQTAGNIKANMHFSVKFYQCAMTLPFSGDGSAFGGRESRDSVDGVGVTAPISSPHNSP